MKSILRVLGGILCALVLASPALAQTGGIRGTVKDPSGAVVPGARVTATAVGTGAQRMATTDKDGAFELVSVPVAHYDVEIEAAGFKKFVQKDVAVDIGHVVVVTADLVLGQSSQTITVEASGAQVETTSTQIGAVVNQRSVSELPLNARDVYQLLQIQPGVQSQVGIDLFYGSDKAGVVSVNGGRGRSNNYSVNGGEGNDLFANIPAIQPSPDSIEEFRVITNTFDAEYGRNSGAEVNVVTKSGTNDFHGSIYEFFRNKLLNARGFLDDIKPDSKQNQYGGTIGGPIKRDKTFIFGSYEGRRAIKGTSTQPITFPTGPEQMGDFSAGSTFGGTISPTIASILMNRGSGACNAALPASAQANLAAAAGGVTQTYDTIFPGNIIPPACFDPVAADLLHLIRPSALPPGGLVPGTTNTFQFVPNSFNKEDQFTIKIDHHLTSTQTLTGYYYYEHDNNLDPRAFFQAGGANIGTFGGLYDQATQQLNVSHTWTIGTSAVNEARFTFFREGQGKFNHPQRTDLTTNSCVTSAAKPFCFTGSTDVPAASILNSTTLAPIAPPQPSYGVSSGLGASREGVPNIVVGGGFSLGNNFEGEFVQAGNTFEWSDTFSKVIGKHSLKFGGDFRYQKFDQTLYFDLNGQDIIGNSGFGNSISSSGSYPNYLLGLVDFYLQGGAQNEFIRSKSLYLFAQDSWKIKPNLTLNYGLRWELNTPLTDIGKKVQTFRPGRISTVFPCGSLTAAEVANLGAAGPNDCTGAGVTPVGLVFPGDAGVPDGLTRTYHKSFGPRVGLAWSPDWKDGWLKSLFGGPGKTSIRMGFGIFYNPIEQLVLEQFSAEPPFGGSAFFSGVLLQAPYITETGLVNPNPFGAGILNPPRAQPTDFARFRPILLFGDAQPNLRSQYAEQYNLTIQRELPGNILFQVAYVGTQGHRLLASYDLNHGNPQTCLDLNMILGSGTCGPGFEDSTLYQIPAGTVLPVALHLPYAPAGIPLVIPKGTMIGPNGINFVGTRPFSAPLCNPYGAFPGNGCPADGVSVFSNIFAQDTVANSNYNSFQLLVEKKFSHGVQLQGAYTFSRSIDNASSFENTLNPVNFSATRGLSLFDARHRFVLSYYWEFPVPKMQGFAGKLLNGWASSGIATVQSGFPIRFQTSTIDNELFSSFDFEAPGEPNVLGPFRTQDPRRSACALGTGPTARPTNNPNFPGPPPACVPVPNAVFDPNLFTATAFDPSSGTAQIPGTVTLGTIGNAPRTLCCGPGITNVDISILKNTQLTERLKMQFRAEFFNVFNHAQFIGVQGDISGTANSGAAFGSVLRARDPRLIQFALKFMF